MKTKKKISKTETGKPKSQIDLDPQLKKQNGLHSEEAIDLTASPIQEKALTIIQRQLRSRIFKRYLSKMKRAREVSKRKLASPEKLKVRAERAARTILKKRFAGRKGTSYQDLSTSEKIQVDKRLEGKAKLIKRIAQRLVPKLRKMDIQRLRSFYQGKQLKHHTDKSPAPQAQVNESFEKMIKMFDNDDQNILKNILNKDPNQLVGIIESMIGELENQNNPIAPTLKEILDKVAPQNPVYTCLTEKSSKSGIPFNILEQVFNRGLQNCDETTHQFSKEQYAFNRVNSYISKGKAYELDFDLRKMANISIEESMNENERTTDFKLIKVTLPNGKTVWRKERKEIKEISGEGATETINDRQKKELQKLKIKHAQQDNVAKIQNLKKEEVDIFENDQYRQDKRSDEMLNLNKHISDFAKSIKSSAAKQSIYKKDGKPVLNMKHVETDSGHQEVFDHLKKMGYKKTSGYDPKPNGFEIVHNRDTMTSRSEPVQHPSGVSAYVEKEHGGKTKVHFAHREMKKEEVEISEAENTGLAAKAEKSGISIGVLRKVYNRGVAAWNSGHRPGTTPQQWGMARVNSYVTKGKGTYYGADKDLHEVSIEEGTVPKDKESGLPKKYVAGLSASTAKARAAHFDKADKLSDSDPEAYKPAPGDANAKTKLSKHTLKYKAMFERNKQNALMRKTMDASRGARFKLRKDTIVPDPEPQHKTAQAYNKALGRAIRQMSNEDKMPTTFGEDDISVSQNKNLTLNAAFIMSNMSESEQPIELTQLLALEHLIKIGFNMVLEEVDDEGKMAVGQLSSLIKNAQSLIKIMTDNKQLDGWVQAKITKASDYINSVQEYLDNNKQDVDD